MPVCSLEISKVIAKVQTFKTKQDEKTRKKQESSPYRQYTNTIFIVIVVIDE